MNDWNSLAFLVFPYVCLAVFVVGHTYRYFSDPYRWNAKSSELLDKEGLKYSSVLFHYGIVFTFFGHAAGLLIPQASSICWVLTVKCTHGLRLCPGRWSDRRR